MIEKTTATTTTQCVWNKEYCCGRSTMHGIRLSSFFVFDICALVVSVVVLSAHFWSISDGGVNWMIERLNEWTNKWMDSKNGAHRTSAKCLCEKVCACVHIIMVVKCRRWRHPHQTKHTHELDRSYEKWHCVCVLLWENKKIVVPSNYTKYLKYIGIYNFAAAHLHEKCELDLKLDCMIKQMVDRWRNKNHEGRKERINKHIQCVSVFVLWTQTLKCYGT